jgi:flagellar basal-body rod protein FlgB
MNNASVLLANSNPNTTFATSSPTNHDSAGLRSRSGTSNPPTSEFLALGYLRAIAPERDGAALAESPLVAIDFGSINTMQAALTFHRERHTVLAGNIANIDTPGYKPVDLDRSVDPQTGAATDIHQFDDTGPLVGPDGNGVSLERELAKIDANRTRYATTAELVSRRFALLRYAAGDGT